jgi:hypothetical protein
MKNNQLKRMMMSNLPKESSKELIILNSEVLTSISGGTVVNCTTNTCWSFDAGSCGSNDCWGYHKPTT